MTDVWEPGGSASLAGRDELGGLRKGDLGEIALHNFSGRSQWHRRNNHDLRWPLVWSRVLCGVFGQLSSEAGEDGESCT